MDSKIYSEISKLISAGITLTSGKRGNSEELRTSNYERNVINVIHVCAINFTHQGHGGCKN